MILSSARIQANKLHISNGTCLAMTAQQLCEDSPDKPIRQAFSGSSMDIHKIYLENLLSERNIRGLTQFFKDIAEFSGV